MSANFVGSGNEASLSVTMADNSGTPGFGSSNANAPLLNGQLTPNGSGGSATATADTNVVFNNGVTTTGTNGQNAIQTGSTITIKNVNDQPATRPQSVWYTVSASGTGTDGSSNITQASYQLTPDENNNIFAVNTGKIAGAASMNDGAGGVGGNNSTAPVYTTAVGGTKSNTANNNGGNNAIAVNTPSANGLQTGSADAAQSRATSDITLSQNYLPLGITENVKDAYFNHNGII